MHSCVCVRLLLYISSRLLLHVPCRRLVKSDSHGNSQINLMRRLGYQKPMQTHGDYLASSNIQLSNRRWRHIRYATHTTRLRCLITNIKINEHHEFGGVHHYHLLYSWPTSLSLSVCSICIVPHIHMHNMNAQLAHTTNMYILEGRGITFRRLTLRHYRFTVQYSAQFRILL